MTRAPDDDPLPVVRASDLDDGDTLARWLVDTLWARAAVGVLGGAPKCCLCRARHKQHYPASRIMPRPRSEAEDLWTSLLIDAA